MLSFGKVPRGEQRIRRGTALTLFVGILFTLFILKEPFISLQWRLSDLLFLPGQPTSNVVIVAVDDASLEAFGKWSEWPRSYHTKAIENLSKAGARVIGLDILFSEPSADDDTFAQAISNAGNVVLAVAGAPGLRYREGAEFTYERFLRPTPKLLDNVASVGHSNSPSDGDGVVRRLPLVVRDKAGNEYPSLSIATLHRFFSKLLPEKLTADNGRIRLLDTPGPPREALSAL